MAQTLHMTISRTKGLDHTRLEKQLETIPSFTSVHAFMSLPIGYIPFTTLLFKEYLKN